MEESTNRDDSGEESSSRHGSIRTTGEDSDDDQDDRDRADQSDREELMEEQEAVIRAGAKEKLLRNLRTHNVELRASDIHGVGVFALTQIPKGTSMFQFNEEPSSHTIKLTPQEIGTLPDHVQKTLKAFILPYSTGSYPVPKHGLSCALGLSWFLNSSEGCDRQANVEFGNKRDKSGYVEIITTKDVEKDDELLVPYRVENSMRGMATISNTANGQERQDPLPEDVSPCCRICQKDLPFGNGRNEDVVDIGCNCRNSSRMCRGCAVRWFLRRITIQLTQHKPDDIAHEEIVNEWLPGVSVTCEVCRHMLSPGFSKTLLHAAAASEHASPAVVAINKRVASTSRDVEPVAVQISRVPGYKTVAVTSSDAKGRRRHRGYRRVRESYSYSHLGKRSRQNQRQSSGRAEGRAIDTPLWKPSLEPGHFSQKQALFWMDDKKNWLPGRIHEYVPAEERNKCGCGNAVCVCPKYSRGMYRYKIEGMDNDDYFSDDDRTVKVDGRSGKDLWQPSG